MVSKFGGINSPSVISGLGLHDALHVTFDSGLGQPQLEPDHSVAYTARHSLQHLYFSLREGLIEDMFRESMATSGEMLFSSERAGLALQRFPILDCTRSALVAIPGLRTSP